MVRSFTSFRDANELGGVCAQWKSPGKGGRKGPERGVFLHEGGAGRGGLREVWAEGYVPRHERSPTLNVLSCIKGTRGPLKQTGLILIPLHSII